jgi:hypothetical protein
MVYPVMKSEASDARNMQAPEINPLDHPNSLIKESKKTPKVDRVPRIVIIMTKAEPTTTYP